MVNMIYWRNEQFVNGINKLIEHGMEDATPQAISSSFFSFHFFSFEWEEWRKEERCGWCGKERAVDGAKGIARQQSYLVVGYELPLLYRGPTPLHESKTFISLRAPCSSCLSLREKTSGGMGWLFFFFSSINQLSLIWLIEKRNKEMWLKRRKGMEWAQQQQANQQRKRKL